MSRWQIRCAMARVRRSFPSSQTCLVAAKPLARKLLWFETSSLRKNRDEIRPRRTCVQGGLGVAVLLASSLALLRMDTLGGLQPRVEFCFARCAPDGIATRASRAKRVVALVLGARGHGAFGRRAFPFVFSFPFPAQRAFLRDFVGP